MRQIVGSKKYSFVIIAVILVIGLALTGLLWWRQYKSTQSDYVAQKCADYGGTYDSFGPGSIKNIANDSKEILIATVENPDSLSKYGDNSTPRIKVTQVLKGNIRKNEIIPICSGMGLIKLPEGDHPTILVFIEGKDGSDFVPAWGLFGIVPQGQNEQFAPKWVSDGPKSVTIPELQSLIK